MYLLSSPLGVIRVALHGKGTAATRAALPIPISMRCIFISKQRFGIFNMRADADRCMQLHTGAVKSQTFNDPKSTRHITVSPHTQHYADLPCTLCPSMKYGLT